MALKFCANLTTLFNEVDFLSRFEAAAEAGFKGVECLFPYDWKKEDLAGRLRKHGLSLVLFNLPAGDWAAGERGTACVPGREGEFRDGIGPAVEYAKALGCGQINCLVGKTPAGVPADEIRRTLVDNLRFAAESLGKEGVRLLIEAVNSQDLPGFHMTRTVDALEIMDEVNHPNLGMLYDVYHMQIMEGNLTRTLLTHLDRIRHIHVADNPGRHEPGTGEINYANLLRALDKAGYSGWIGCEYKPAGKTADGLGWLRQVTG
ncbi:MAG: hydroxypyruvate isomerase [Syntrophobacteraceae bacterium]|nr:hydroxypyruvate isomerase [Desulfobacteraceae bacterium]